MRRPDFFLSFGDPEVTVARADLERLVGSYEDKEKGLAIKVDLAGSRLRVNFVAEDFQLLLIPTSPTRFRFEGMAPGRTLTFQLAGGRATAVTQSGPGEPDLVLKRAE